MSKKIILSWSGGKDSALALYALQKDPNYEIISLLTTVTEEYERISMHGVRIELLEKQAKEIGLPLKKVFIPKNSNNKIYEERMGQALREFKLNGVIGVAFGDLFLEDLRKYREDKLAQIGLEAIFPIWTKDTKKLSKYFTQNKFKAILTCVDENHLSENFVGRYYDLKLLADLPKQIDPCGENGEFHSFVFEGPIFKNPLNIKKGKIVKRDNRFWYCDVISDF
ncbi:MAG: diphthine--ammonia ligase [archaeon]|jgi:uncharacterized protein (TIGR00290 family)